MDGIRWVFLAVNSISARLCVYLVLTFATVKSSSRLFPEESETEPVQENKLEKTVSSVASYFNLFRHCKLCLAVALLLVAMGKLLELKLLS